MTSTPIVTCLSTISFTALRTVASKVAGATGAPPAAAWSWSSRSSGRGRLPTCVVRMRSVLRFTMVVSL
jgi:hypothetical protein